MKAISIKAKTAEKVISAELDTVQNRCTVRTITFRDILDALETIERRFGIPKASLGGTKIDVYNLTLTPPPLIMAGGSEGQTPRDRRKAGNT